MPWYSSVINPLIFKPMKLSWTPLWIAAACLPLAVGCASHRGAYEPLDATPETAPPKTDPPASTIGAYAPLHATEPSLENQAGFVLLDRYTQKSVTCTGIQLTHLPDGRLQVAAQVLNLERKRIQVQVNCVFKDEQGFSYGDETPFQTLILTESATESVQFVSMSDRAKKYTIRVRQAR